MNRFQKRIMIIAAGLGNISLCLTAAGVATYAWFALKSNVATVSDDMEITVKQSSTVNFEILKYDQLTNKVTHSNDTDDFYLPQYDQYITEKNKYANAIIRAEFFIDSFSSASKDLTITISSPHKALMDEEDDTKIKNVTSNVVEFKSFVHSYKTSENGSFIGSRFTESSYKVKYEEAKDIFDESPNSTTFVNIRDLGQNTITLERDPSADSITLVPTLPASTTIYALVVYIECSYNETLAEEYVKSYNNSEESYELHGDITAIDFNSKSNSGSSSLATGRFIPVDCKAEESDSYYLPVYKSGSTAKVLDGSKTAGNIDATNNFVDQTIKSNSVGGGTLNSIEDRNLINTSAFYHKRSDGSFKSSNNYYIGNDENSEHIKTSASPIENNITYSGGTPTVKGTGSGSNTKLKYNSNQFNYYTSSGSDINLYKYTSNAMPAPTVVSIALDEVDVEEYFCGQTFTLPDTTVIATYSNSSQVDVTRMCDFVFSTGSGDITLRYGQIIPDSLAGEWVDVAVQYNEGTTSVTAGDEYYAIISLDTATSLDVTGTISGTYDIGDTIDTSAVTQVIANFASGAVRDVTAGTVFRYGTAGDSAHTTSVETALTDAYLGGANTGTINVYAVYNDCYQLAGSITLNKYILTLSENSFTLGVGGTATLTMTYNANVTITVTSGSSACLNTFDTTHSYTGSNLATQEKSLTFTAANTGDMELTFSINTVSSTINRTCSISVTSMSTQTGTITFGSASGSVAISSNNASGNDSLSNTWSIVSSGFHSNSADYSQIGSSNNQVTTATFSMTLSGTKTFTSVSAKIGGFSDTAGTVTIQVGSTTIGSGNLTTSDTSGKVFENSSTASGTTLTITFTKTGVGRIKAYYISYTIADNKTLSSIATSGQKATIGINSAFDYGGTVTATYSDSSTRNVTATATIDSSNVDTTEIGEYTVNISYTEGGVTRTTSYTVEVVDALQSISISGDLTTKTYSYGDTINVTGLTVTANYAIATSANVTASATWKVGDTALASYHLPAGITSITLTASYTENNIIKTANITITGLTVSSTPVTSITITTPITTVIPGDTYQLVWSVAPANASDNTVTWSSDNQKVTVSETGLVSVASDATLGDVATITATAHDGSGVTQTTTLTVASVTALNITTQPKKSFSVGDTFSFDGVATATYNTTPTSTGTVTPTVTANKGLSVGDTLTADHTGATVTLTYGGQTATYEITVNSGTTELTFNLSSNPGSWPTVNDSSLTDYTYALNGTNYTFKLLNVKCNSGYLMCTKVAVLGLPAISGKKLTKVVAYNSGSCSTSVRVGISSSSTSESYVTGGGYQTWSKTSSSYTYNLTGTSNNTVYYLYVTNKNAQITSLVLTYE